MSNYETPDRESIRWTTAQRKGKKPAGGGCCPPDLNMRKDTRKPKKYKKTLRDKRRGSS